MNKKPSAKIIPVLLVLLTALPYSVYSQTAADFNRMGVRAGEEKKYDTAVDLFNKSVQEYDKASASTFHNLGWSYEQLGQTDQALSCYEEAVRRNPDLVHSLERLGYLQYRKGLYYKSIIAGERVLELDPRNTDVLKWLPDAYAQRFKQREQMLAQQTKQEENREIEKAVEKDRQEEKKYRKMITVNWDMTIRSSYEFPGKNDYGYNPTQAMGPDFPHMFYLDFQPVDSWQLLFRTGVPYHGALSEEIISWTERIESVFYKGHYFLGAGVMGNHYKGRSMFGSSMRLDDYKIGFLFGKYEKKARLDVQFYPRLFPYDAGYSGNKTLDADCLDVSYKYAITPELRLLFKSSFNDYYFFDHAVPYSNYFGIYDFTFGLAFFDKPSSKFVLTTMFTERLYLEDTGNEKPYKMANGQGFFGINAYKWFKGEPMSGFKTAGHVFTIKAEERFLDHLFIYQSAIVEIVSTNRARDDFSLQLGVGGYY